MGVKIPQLGYLDPHPSLHFENLKNFYLPIRQFYFQLYLKRISRDLKKPMELCYISKLGYLDPHPSLHFENLKNFYLPIRQFYFQLYLKRISRDLKKPMELCYISSQ